MAIVNRFQASGLSSGLDTALIIDQLVKLQSRPIEQLRVRQAGFINKASSIASLALKISLLNGSSDSLGTGGVRKVLTSSTNTGFNATPANGAVPGRYSIKTKELAIAAQQRSAGFNSTDLVRGGTLSLTVKGAAYSISITDGSAIGVVATSIQTSGAPVLASVVNDGTKDYLVISNRETGHTVGSAASTALSSTETSTGSASNKKLSLSDSVTAKNATVDVDGLSVERQSNTISDVIPYVTLSLKVKNTTAEDLVLVGDVTGTKERLQSFVTAYNDVTKALAAEIAAPIGGKAAGALVGDSTLLSLQNRLRGAFTTNVSSLKNLKSLSDLGVRLQRDGTATIDETVLGAALNKNPLEVDLVFSTKTDGVAAKFTKLNTDYLDSRTGILTNRKTGLDKSTKEIDETIRKKQEEVDSFRERLVRQFAQLEKIISSFKSVGRFLDQQVAVARK